MNEEKKVFIAKDAIAEIVYTSAISVSGVSDLVKINPKSIVLNKNNKNNYVILKNVNDELEITINLKLVQGCNINEVPKKVQQKVKEDVQNITSSLVSKVNIMITDLAEHSENQT